MKILLTTLNSKYVHSNLALKYLYTVTAPEYSDIRVREFTINNTRDYVFGEIIRENCEMVCFSTYVWNVEQIKDICADLKKARPELLILLGGPEVSFNGHLFASENHWADYILTGEGEYSFYRLCQVLHGGGAGLDTVPGLIYRENGRIYANSQIEPMDMNSIPFPYSILDCDEDRVVYYESSRGCPYRCTYCLSSVDKRVRALDVQRVKAEIGYFLHKNVMQVKFIDRTFNYDRDRAYEIMKYIIDNDNGHTSFHFELCADLIDERLFELLAAARRGLFELEMGVQSTNPKTLNAIKRNENVYPVLNNISRLTAMKNLHTHVDLIAGLPFETYETFGKSFNRVYALHADTFQLGFLKVLRGTPMEKMTQRHGIVYRDRAPYEVISTFYISAEDMVRLKAVEDMVDIYYNRGGFEKSVPYLIKRYSMHIGAHQTEQSNENNAFSFYEALADYYYSNGYQDRDRKKDDQYRILKKFMQSLSLSILTEAEADALIQGDAENYMDELNFKRFISKGWDI